MNNANTDTPRVNTPDGLEVLDSALYGLVVRAHEHNRAMSESARYKALAEKLARGLEKCAAHMMIKEEHESYDSSLYQTSCSYLTEARAAGLLKEGS